MAKRKKKHRPRESDLAVNVLKIVGVVSLCVVSAAIGGGISRHWGTAKYDISYSDFVVIMLTAIAVLMTVLAIFLATFGVIGWATLEGRVQEAMDKIEERTQRKIDKFVVDSKKKMEIFMRSKSKEIMYEGIQPFGDIPEDNDAGNEDEGGQ